jgi:N-acetylmuramoyl-L-alanine amidase
MINTLLRETTMKILLLILTIISGSLKANDIDCLAMAIYYEAGNQSILGKMAVANVIEYRLEKRRTLSGYCDVVKQPEQFSFYWDGQPEPMPKNRSKAEFWALWESRIIAWVTWIGILPDIVNGADHYHNDKIEKPDWTYTMKQTAQIGNHTFYESK